MNNFTYYVPTKVYFGKGQISHLCEMKESGNKALLVYGGGSIRKIGIYDEATKILKDSGITIYELSGVEPNPKIELVREGAKICKDNAVDMVLAIGGGSVIDSAKVIAAGACYEGDCWDLVENPSKITAALPIYTVLTLSATGSEMNKNAVISDMSRNLKTGTSSDLFKPRISICDPTYTFTVSAKQTAAGTADIISHSFENYFSPVKDTYLASGFSQAVLRTCFRYGPIAMKEPENYEARANLMWASTNAINGITQAGAACGWSCHPMEHELSAFYDITHGVGLAILTPRWMKHILSSDTLWKFVEYGKTVWDLEGEDIEIAKKAIRKTADYFYKDLGLPETLGEVGIDNQKFVEMAEHASVGLGHCFVPLNKEDVLAIYKDCLVPFVI